ncbi:LysR family transcriptional regulator [Roseomonas sp. NAR14]|uniref:LysR family transcriptional regulator n=1 Tax=Roseomonas acroporae TaxID=2937791 RepID=A0A9X1YGW9_9PROT|nr:LysR family transcriptional regulator [Roseomonas acroporae]MCK8786061.1 LysR family transcriptional regulator [Roseomonas acroporae]
MDFRDLAYFEAAAELGHLGRAAVRMGRTQSALSKSIRRLEEELGLALFARQGRGIVLTAAGEMLLDRARVLRQGMELARRQMRDFSRGITGHVRLGASSTMAALLLPGLSARFLAGAPDVTVQLTIGLNDVLRDSLQAGRIDLMLGPLEESEPLFSAHPLLDDEVVIVAGPDHPILSGRRRGGAPLECAALAGCRWVLPSRQVATRRWLEARLREAGVPLGPVQLETNSILVLSQVIARNRMLSLLSRRNLGAGRPGHPLREVPVAGMVMRRRFGVLYRAEATMTPATACLLALVKQADGTDP